MTPPATTALASALLVALLASSCGLPPSDPTAVKGTINRTLLEGRVTRSLLTEQSFIAVAARPSGRGSFGPGEPATFEADGSFRTRAPMPGARQERAQWRLLDPSRVEIGGVTYAFDEGQDCLYHDDWCLIPRVDDALLGRLAAEFRGWEALNLTGQAAVTDAGVGQLSSMADGLVTLRLNGTTITDASMPLIGALSRLRILSLAGTAVTDEGLRQLARLVSLRVVSLPPATTDEGLASLASLKSLHQLWLSDTRVSDAGLAGISGLSELTLLDLTGTAVTDRGLLQLLTLKKLHTLYLPEGVSGEGLRFVSALGSLNRLRMAGKVSDQHLGYLSRAKQLRALVLVGAAVDVSDEAVDRLEQQLPDLRVYRETLPESDT